jgi:hypothetical protein
MLYLLTILSTSTIYPEDPTATPAPAYRRHARDLPLKQRASWCDDRPCRLVRYDDDTISEACKKYLGWAPSASTVSVPGYTVTITSYPTDCKKKDDGYKSEPAPTEAPEPAYPEEQPSYDDGSDDDSHHNDGTAPWEDTNTDDSQHSDDLQPWENAFDTNYDGPDGPKPWDDVDETSELADAIEAGGYDDAAAKLGLDDTPWNKRDSPAVEDEGYGYDGEDASEEPSEPEDTTDSYPEVPAPNIYGPDAADESSHPDGPWTSHDDSSDDGSVWVLPDSSEYEGDEFEADYYPKGDAPDFGADADAPTYASSYGEDGVDY